MDGMTEQILRRRMHGLYLTRGCGDIVELSRELMGLHCWFHRNVVFSALIRGARVAGWKTALTKTWIHHALHGVAPEDLRTLLAVHAGGARFEHRYWDGPYLEIADRVISLMEDGIYSRAEMRVIFAEEYEGRVIERAFSPWGGVFTDLARIGKVAFRDMTSRDFDLIDAEPTRTFEDVLPELLQRFFAAYGPATLSDAAWFFGLSREKKKALYALDVDGYARFEYNKNVYYYVDDGADMGDIPALTLLSGFDPLIVSYTERGAVLPPEYRSAVITKSGICLPTIAIDGQVAGLWNIKKGEPAVEFFTPQTGRVRDAVFDMVEGICQETRYLL